MIQGFEEFVSKDNMLDLVVVVAIGASFIPTVKSVTDVIMGIIDAVVGQPNLDSVLQFPVNGSSPIQPGTTITVIVDSPPVALTFYFIIVVPMNAFKRHRAKGKAEKAEGPSGDIKLLDEIRDLFAEKN